MIFARLPRAVRWLLDTGFGLVRLLQLAVAIRFRFRGRYWRWRTETAFGRGWPESRVERLHAVLELGRWMHRMRRMR